MRIAVISDIHSNIDALESVLEDIETRAVDEIICTGDLVGYLPFPNEVIKRFKEDKIKTVMGNHDQRVAEHVFKSEMLLDKASEEVQASASLLYTSQTITDEHRNYLKQLPMSMTLKVKDKVIRFVHGSPSRIDEYLYQEDDELRHLSQTLEEDALVFGHTHLAYHKILNNKHFINAGSVGKPKQGSSKSSYVIISITEDNITVEIEEVSYEIQSLCRAIKSNPMINDKLCENIILGN